MSEIFTTQCLGVRASEGVERPSGGGGVPTPLRRYFFHFWLQMVRSGAYLSDYYLLILKDKREYTLSCNYHFNPLSYAPHDRPKLQTSPSPVDLCPAQR